MEKRNNPITLYSAKSGIQISFSASKPHKLTKKKRNDTIRNHRMLLQRLCVALVAFLFVQSCFAGPKYATEGLVKRAQKAAQRSIVGLLAQQKTATYPTAFDYADFFESPFVQKSPEAVESLCRKIQREAQNIDPSLVIHLSHSLKCSTVPSSALSQSEASKGSLADVAAFALTRSTDPLTFVLRVLENRVDAQGWISWTTGADHSPLASAYALRLLAQLAAQQKTIPNNLKSTARLIASRLFKSVDSVDETSFFVDDVSDPSGLIPDTVIVTSALLKAFSELQPFVNNVVSQASVPKFGAHLVQQADAEDLDQSFAVWKGLEVLSEGNLGKPIALTVEGGLKFSKAAFSSGIQVTTTDLLGGKVETTTKVISVKDRDDTNSDDFAKNVKLTKNSKGFLLQWSGASAKAGVLVLELSVEAVNSREGYIPLRSVEEAIVVTTEVATTDATFGVHASKSDYDTPILKETIPFGRKFSSSVGISNGNYISLSFDLKEAQSKQPLRANQVFLRLINKENADMVAYPLAFQQGKYSIRLAVSNDIVSRFGVGDAVFQAAIIVADSSITNPILWDLGQITLSGPAQASPKSSRITDSLPEIHHQFRLPEKRPPAVVSYVFTIAVAAPFLLFIVGVFKISPGFTLPSTVGFIDAFCFHVGLGLILLLNLAYWLHFDMFTTMGYLGLLCLVTFSFGRRVLSSLPEVVGIVKAKAD